MLYPVILLLSNFAVSAPVTTPLILPFFYPDSSAGIPNYQPNAFVDLSDIEIAQAALWTEVGASTSDVVLDRSYIDEFNVNHLYFSRMIDGLVVSNQNAAVHILDGIFILISGAVTYLTSSFSLSTNFARRETPIQRSVIICESQAVKIAEDMVGVQKDEFNTTLGYVQSAAGLVYAYTFQLRSDVTGQWFQVSVNAQTGKITLMKGMLVQAIDYTAHATYRALILPNSIPVEGFQSVVNPFNAAASPFGWNSDGRTTWTNTQGNNLQVAIGTTLANGNANLLFDSAWNSAQVPTSTANRDASSKSLFYVLNMVHDIAYQFGFTERAGNFQQNNRGLGGIGNDRVIISSQSSSGTNNANFATPPDGIKIITQGQSGRMNMYLWTFTNPGRDGSLDSKIPIHEYTHGISNRLTGGPANAACLQTLEAAGLGEGWSDAVAVFLTQKSTYRSYTNIAMGWYVVGQTFNGNGVRRYPYSTSLNTNPLLFSQLRIDTVVHRIGEVWASMMFEMYWNLVNALGFTPNWFDARQIRGNIVAMQIMIGGMMLQPCNPTFTQARDALLAAEIQYYKGAYRCHVWRAFAKRGLGTNSIQSGYTNGFNVPSGC